jgi:DoxX-like protein
MSANRQRAALTALRWTVGIVVLWQSYRFIVSTAAVRNLQHMGLPQWFVPLIGGVELVAAALFLVPKLDRIGGYSLLVVFAVACAIHGLHGELEAALLVYAAAVVACMATSPEIARNPL